MVLRCSFILNQHVLSNLIIVLERKKIMFIGIICVKVSALSAELSEVQQSHRMDVSETAAWLKDPVEPLSLLWGPHRTWKHRCYTQTYALSLTVDIQPLEITDLMITVQYSFRKCVLFPYVEAIIKGLEHGEWCIKAFLVWRGDFTPNINSIAVLFSVLHIYYQTFCTYLVI